MGACALAGQSAPVRRSARRTPKHRRLPSPEAGAAETRRKYSAIRSMTKAHSPECGRDVVPLLIGLEARNQPRRRDRKRVAVQGRRYTSTQSCEIDGGAPLPECGTLADLIFTVSHNGTGVV